MITSLHPPEVELTPSLRWVLEAAFSAAEPDLPERDALPQLESLANRCGLVERIAGRGADARLPPETRAVFRSRLTKATATSLFYESIARDVASTAARLDVPVAFLKGLAFFLLEISPAGSRPFGDLDILVPSVAAETVWRTLRSRSFEPVSEERTEQHLPGLRGPRGGLLEIHFALRGLLASDGRALELDELRARDGLVHLVGHPGLCFVPTRDLLAAHILVHGFQQHLLRPRSYPLLRMVGDLQDLLPTPRQWGRMKKDWGPAISSVVQPEDLKATERLCLDLADGKVPDSRATGARTLFDHLVAGALDDDYATSLAPDYLRNRLGEATRRGELSSYLLRKISLTRHRGEFSPLAWLTHTLGRVGRGLLRQFRALFVRTRIGKRSL